MSANTSKSAYADALDRIIHATFPFYFRFDRRGTITRAGRSLVSVLPDIIGAKIGERFELRRPVVALDFESLRALSNTLLLMVEHTRGLSLRGQVEPLDDELLFLCSPWFTRTADLSAFGLTFGDFAPNDPILDLLVEVHAAEQGMKDARRLVENLEKEKARAREGSKSRAEFLATISHELRTPLNAILGMSSLLLESELQPNQIDCVETIRSSGGQLLELVNDILDFTKMDSQSIRLEAEPFDLFGCIEEAIDLVSRAASLKRLRLAYNISADMPGEVVGDVTRLRQVLVNLLSNAVKFTKSGHVVLRVRTRGDDFIEFEVEDTGIGMPAHELERIFEPFSQVSSSMAREFGGTGLGLSISRRIVRVMGGEVRVKSTVDEGSTFSFSISLRSVRTSPTSDDLSGSGVAVIVGDEAYRECISGCARALGASVTASTPESFPTGEKPQVIVVCDDDAVERLAPHLARWSDVPVVTVRTAAAIADDDSSWLRMPVRRPPLARALRAALGRERPSNNAHVSSTPPLRVLVVDDNLTNQKVTLALLGRLNQRADAVSSGPEAMDAVALRPYDLVLMDVQMPEMDGLEATRRIRTTPSGRALNIVALTANAFREHQQACLDAGMNGYLTKPVRLDELRRCLGQAVQGIGTVPPRSASASAVDVRRIHELGLSDELLGVIVEAYLADASAQIAKLRAANASEPARVRSAAHALKGSSANLGVRRVELICQRIEDGSDPCTPAILEQLERELSEAAMRLRLLSSQIADAGRAKTNAQPR